jgi:hypothetical protein
MDLLDAGGPPMASLEPIHAHAPQYAGPLSPLFHLSFCLLAMTDFSAGEFDSSFIPTLVQLSVPKLLIRPFEEAFLAHMSLAIPLLQPNA